MSILACKRRKLHRTVTWALTVLSASVCGPRALAQDASASGGGSWRKLTDEWTTFSVIGAQRVRFGSGTHWIEKTVSGTVPCRNDYFGSDPAYGITKECDLWVANTTPPPSQDAGTPPPQDAGAPPPRDSPALGTPRSSARFFISGHSLTYDPFGDYVVSIAQSLGSSAQYNEQIMMGSAIHYRVRGNGNESDTGFDGYSQGLNRGGGSNMNVIQELRHPQTLGGDLYDTLLITERYDLLVVIDYDKTARYLRHVHERLIEGNPQANTYFFEPWYSVNDKGDPRDWIVYQRTAHPVWKCVATRINQSLAAEGRRDRIASLPAATAMAELIERATQGNVDGVTGSSVLETVERIISDDVHMTLLGKYYMALVTYGALYRRSPIGAWFPNDVTSTQANSLQHIAWDYVSNYYASGDSALSLAQCQTLVQNSFCNTYWNYYSDPGQIPNCLKRFAQQDDGNPFYYNATTDSGYWFPAPP